MSPPSRTQPSAAPRLPRGRDQTLASSSYKVRLGWGLQGALALAPHSDVIVVVDVLSFSTSVTVAVERGCRVYPHPWAASAEALALRLGAELAVRRTEVGPEHPYSLSPATLARAPRGAAIVLPSPNGSTIAAAAAGEGAVVVAGCLRNAASVARYARSRGQLISVIAAGERWPDESLDPALEDQIGAGAIIDGLRRRRRSPEATAAAAVFRQARHQGLLRVLEATVSGLEQRDRGFWDELPWAAALNVSRAVPVLRDGAFQLASGTEVPEASPRAG